MKITIQGVDYTSALDASHPLTIDRTLNRPSVCQLWLSLPMSGHLTAPARNQSIEVASDECITYFTGYIATNPFPEYAGFGMEGARCRIAIQAISDELLLDQLSMMSSSGIGSVSAGALLMSLVGKTGATSLSTQALALDAPISHLLSHPGASWSAVAGSAANLARSAYRAISGALSLASLPTAVHALSEADGSLTLAHLSLTGRADKALANDITVCGDLEPTSYVSDYFLGDGVTTQFNLSATPYSLAASRSHVIRELFDGPAIDRRVWGGTSGAQYFSLCGLGLSMQGGNGIDGDVALTWIDPVEMGGTLLLEAAGVNLAAGSDGILAGFFVGLETQSACTAGFKAIAQQGTGAVTIQPVIQGVPAGMTYNVNSSAQYTLRIRVHCPEIERTLAVYRSYVDSGPVTYGGQSNVAPARLHFEIQEFVNGVAGMPVTLNDGSVSNMAATCSVVVASSINLLGSIRSVNLSNLGSGWVVNTISGGGPQTRRLGTTAESAECNLESGGRLVYYPGYTPTVGEQIKVTYRTAGRAIGRAVNGASQQSLALAGLPSVAAWTGSVSSPNTRSSQDCRNAALTLQQAAASQSALLSGTYAATSASFATDVLPGEALSIDAPSMYLNAQVLVRTVKLAYRPSYPDLIEYSISFANDWAEDLAIKTSATVPADAWLPAAISPAYLDNLNGLTVTSLNGNTVIINTGATAPPGGGFEVRRRDYTFMPGQDPDLVMRGSQTNLTFTRAAASERFYIRMFDGAAPPNYSEFSATLIFNLPLAS